MAIAYDNSAVVASWTTSSPATASFTCTGTDRILFVAVMTGGGGSAAPSAATYNGVAMTELGTVTDADGNKNTLLYLVAPATGSNTISITRGGGTRMSIVAASYTGVDQTTPIDDSSTDAGQSSTASSFTSSAVTVGSADNWLIGSFRDVTKVAYSSSDVSQRIASITVEEEIWDSNATVSTGSQTVTYTSTGGQIHGHTLISLAAAGGGGGGGGSASSQAVIIA